MKILTKIDNFFFMIQERIEKSIPDPIKTAFSWLVIMLFLSFLFAYVSTPGFIVADLLPEAFQVVK
jgi:hypothetical protein